LTEFISDNFILISAFVFLLILIINFEIRNTFSNIKKLTIDELTILINSNKVLLIDIREQGEYDNGHIANAKNFTADMLKSIDVRKQEFIVVYSKNDNDAYKAAKVIGKTGKENVCYLEGGIASWLDNNMPLSGENNNG
tara:strand:- start:19072 stop:19488 length:417 start_codon:yes stop_codon:yes gene_type:complete